MNWNITDSHKELIREVSTRTPNQESCGIFLLKEDGCVQAVPCQNVSPSPENHFIISNLDINNLKSKGQIIGLWHSHPQTMGGPSPADIAICERYNFRGLVYEITSDTFYEYSPIGFEFPFEGRPWYLGILDCLQLVIDYYNKILNISIPYIDNPLLKLPPEEWQRLKENSKDANIALNHMTQNGFVEVKDLKNHDVLLFTPSGFQTPIHFGIFIEPNWLLHHPIDKKSEKILYSRAHKRKTTNILRHKYLL